MSEVLRIAVRKFDPFERAIRKQFAAFAAGRNVELEIEALDLNPLHHRLFAECDLAKGRFDIAFLSTDWLAEAQAQGAIVDLRPLIAKEPVADFPVGWSPSLLDLQSFAGGFWGMPYHDGPECLIYRKDLLEAAGLEVPRSWREFVAAARRLHAPQEGRYGTVLALYPDGHNSFYDFCIQVWTRGGEPFDAGARPNLVTPQATDALDFLRILAMDDTAIAPSARELDSVKAGLLFCRGSVAMMANWFGFAALGESWSESAVKGRVDIAPLPAGESGRSVSLNVFWVLAIAAGSSNKALAWSFLRHVASAPMDRLTTMEGAIGVRRSTWSDPDVNRAIPYYYKLDELHAHARQVPLHPRLSQIAAAIDAMLKQALDSDTASLDLLSEAQLRIEEIVA